MAANACGAVFDEASVVLDEVFVVLVEVGAGVWAIGEVAVFSSSLCVCVRRRGERRSTDDVLFDAVVVAEPSEETFVPLVLFDEASVPHEAVMKRGGRVVVAVRERASGVVESAFCSASNETGTVLFEAVVV